MCPSETETAAGGEACVEVRLVVRLSDRAALERYVRARYVACWFDSDWEPSDLAEAVLEAFVISNENPSPADYGIEILESHALLRRPGPPPMGARTVAGPCRGQGGLDGREQTDPMSAALRTVEVRNALWPQGEGVIAPEPQGDSYWRDVEGRPYALAEILAGTSPHARRVLCERHLEAIHALLAASLRDEEQGPGGEARALRHRARRLIGEFEGWWVEQARSARENGSS